MVGGRVQIATLIRSYGLTKYLRPVLKSYAWVDKILVLNGRFPSVKPREDNTFKVIQELGQENVELFIGDSNDLHQSLNFGVEKLQDYDYIFISDADELIQREGQQKLIETAKECGGARCPLIEYAHDYEHIYPIRGHQPIAIIHKDVRFYDVRNAMGGFKSVPDVFIHHFGFVYDNEEIGWKIEWEKQWEKDEPLRIYSQIPKPYEMPKEIRELLNA